jgi:hypothetical protein
MPPTGRKLESDKSNHTHAPRIGSAIIKNHRIINHSSSIHPSIYPPTHPKRSELKMKCSMMMIYENVHLTNLLVFRAGPDGQGGNFFCGVCGLWVESWLRAALR